MSLTLLCGLMLVCMFVISQSKDSNVEPIKIKTDHQK
jgi:hypothetical protein